MKKIFKGILVGLMGLLLMPACQNEAEKAAAARLAQVRTLAGSGKYEPAMALLDSIHVWYTDNYGILNESMMLRDSVADLYHNQMIEVANGMLQTLLPQIDDLDNNFRFTPGEAGRPGIYEHKRQSTQQAWNRSFIKANITEKGEFWISSHYFGQEWLDHYCIKVYDKDLSVFSDTIALSDPRNRKVEDMGDKWETIDFTEGSDGGAAEFIAANQHLSLKVRFTGKKHYYIVVESFDKEAIADGFELAQVLSEKHQLEQTIERNRKALRILGGSKELRNDVNTQNQNNENKN